MNRLFSFGVALVGSGIVSIPEHVFLESMYSDSPKQVWCGLLVQRLELCCSSQTYSLQPRCMTTHIGVYCLHTSQRCVS